MIKAHNVESANHRLPPRRHTSVPYQGWVPYLLGYLEQVSLGDQYDLSKTVVFDPMGAGAGLRLLVRARSES